MKTLEERFHDRVDWGSGPWDDEPDKIQWLDEETGLPCLIVRGRLGALCGYVGVPKSHPCYQVPYGDVRVNGDYPDIHGGLTYSDRCRGAICHAVEPGEDDDVWWLGFDCGHSDDVLPRMPELSESFNAIYKGIGYVQSECRSLARQLIQQTQEGGEQ
jgi:hypothetical protein